MPACKGADLSQAGHFHTYCIVTDLHNLYSIHIQTYNSNTSLHNMVSCFMIKGKFIDNFLSYFADRPLKICLLNPEHDLSYVPTQRAIKKDRERHLQELQVDVLKNLKDLSSKKAQLEELTVIAEKAREEHLKVQDKLVKIKTEYDLMKHEKNKLENDGECEWDIQLS